MSILMSDFLLNLFCFYFCFWLFFSLLNFDFTVFTFWYSMRDTHLEKAPSNKTPILLKSVNMKIWIVGTSNQPFIQGS